MKWKDKFNKIAKICALIIFGILLGWLFFGGSGGPAKTPGNHSAHTNTGGQKKVVYTCSMHPKIRQDEPGKCPICGMDLIPVKDNGDKQSDDFGGLTMSPAAAKIADVETASVLRKPAVKSVKMPGKVAVDEQAVSVIPAHYSGRIEKLYVNFTGAYVKEGEKLASVYSPALVTAQKELLQAYAVQESNPALYQAARKKLKNWEISDRQIDQILKNGTPKTNFIIRAPKEGYVIDLNVKAGDHITKGKPMFKVADLSNVWVIFQAYENELLGLKLGDKIKFTVNAYPGRQFKAGVTYIDPILDPQSRSVSVRTEINNKDALLKPNMLVQGDIFTTLYGGKEVLQVPQSAVLWTGKQSVVYVKKSDEPTFKARDVVLGPELDNSYVIKSGLKVGDSVVVNGNFMIDAATQLAGKPSMMNSKGSKSASKMSGMNMDDGMGKNDSDK